MDDKRWTPARGAAIGPGTLRLQDQHLLVLQSVASVLETAEAQAELASNTEALVRGGQQDLALAKVAAGRLGQWLRQRQRDWATQSFTDANVVAVRRALVQQAGSGQMRDFNAAEQVVLALESLSYTLGDRDRLSSALDRIFTEVEDDATFVPSSFARTARNIQEQF